MDTNKVLHGDYAQIFVVAVLLRTILTPRASHSFSGFLTSRSFFEVEPCEVTLLNVLAPVAAIRDDKRTHLASLAQPFAAHPGHLTHCLPASIFLVLLPVLAISGIYKHRFLSHEKNCRVCTVRTYSPVVLPLAQLTAHLLLTSRFFSLRVLRVSSP